MAMMMPSGRKEKRPSHRAAGIRYQAGERRAEGSKV
jgi:hypothetical protein